MKKSHINGLNPNSKLDNLPMPNPWDQQLNESSKAFERFAPYRDRGAGRSLRKLAKDLELNPSTLAEICKREKWQGRVQAFDAYIDKASQHNQVVQVKAMKRRQIALALRAQKVAEKGLKKYLRDLDDEEVLKNMRPEALSKLLDTGYPMTAAIGVGMAGLSFVVADLWSAFDGGHSVFNRYTKAPGPFLSPSNSGFWICPKSCWPPFLTWHKKSLDSLLACCLIFLRMVFFANVKGASKVYHHMTPIPLNSRMAPQPANWGQNRLTSNQSVNVAVNVKSGANPPEIGGEVSKAVRKELELERERFNAFMGGKPICGLVFCFYFCRAVPCSLT